jgi:hypothetical protein
MGCQKYLLSLIAQKNKLARMEDSVFGNKKYLSHLDLSHNEITECETKKWPCLTSINLNRKFLYRYVICEWHLKNLETSTG